MRTLLPTQVLAGFATAALMLTVSGPSRAADADAAQALAKRSNCFKCHAIDKKKEAVAWKEVAAKRKGKPDAQAKLIKHITTGPKVKLDDGVEDEHPIIKTKNRTRSRTSSTGSCRCSAAPQRCAAVALTVVSTAVIGLSPHESTHFATLSGRPMNEPTPRPSLWPACATSSSGRPRLSLTTVVGIGMLSGLIFWGGFNTGMEQTNSLAFCTSCHEMRDTVFQEYKETIHYKNRSGVRAACPDCHVPKDWGHKFVRKVQASNELYGKFVTGVGRHAGEVRGQADGDGAARVGRDEGERFAGVPQLPLLGGDGSAQAATRAPQEDGDRPEGGQDVHRLPQGHRPPAAQGISRQTRSRLRSVRGRDPSGRT